MKNKRCVKLLSLTLMIIVFLAPVGVFAKTYTASQSYGSVNYSLSADKAKYSYNKKTNETTITVVGKWNWKKQPAEIKYSDIFAMSNGEGFYVDKSNKCKDDQCVQTNAASCSITYVLASGQSADYSDAYKPRTFKYSVQTKAYGKGAFVKFPMKKTIKINGITTIWYAQKGTMTVKWVKKGNVKSIRLSSKYGHSVTNTKPTVSFSLQNKLDYKINFNKKMKYGNECYLLMKSSYK